MKINKCQFCGKTKILTTKCLITLTGKIRTREICRKCNKDFNKIVKIIDFYKTKEI